MKLGRYFLRAENREICGRVENSSVIEIGDYLKIDPKNEIQKKNAFQLTDLEVLTPVLPKKIIAVGLNYGRHARELDMQTLKEPVIFLKPPTAALAHKQSIRIPSMSQRVDYEAELAIVIGRDASNVSEEEALGCVLGYTAFNDVTARDLQKIDGQWTRAKGFDTFAPFGPTIETEIEPGGLRIQAILNGEVKQDSTTSDMLFGVKQIVSFISQIMRLEAGDVIATGTPEGIGPMQKGDEIAIRIEGLDELINRVE